MKKIQYLVLGALAMLVFSCSDNREFAPTFKGDIDGGDWINIYTIGKYWGYTGEYCSRIDSVNRDSYGFRKLTSEISQNPIRRVKISTWVRLENLNNNVNLILSVSGKDSKNIYWESFAINPVIKEANKWFKFEKDMVIPAEGFKIESYVTNLGKNNAYIDDFEIRFFGE